jgi:hypothetical protein
VIISILVDVPVYSPIRRRNDAWHNENNRDEKDPEKKSLLIGGINIQAFGELNEAVSEGGKVDRIQNTDKTGESGVQDRKNPDGKGSIKQ